MSRRADFLQLVAYALKDERPRIGLPFLAAAQVLPEEAIPKAQGLPLVHLVEEYVTWLHSTDRRTKTPEPEWHQAWREGDQETRVLISTGLESDYLDWWEALGALLEIQPEVMHDPETRALKFPVSCRPLLGLENPDTSLVAKKSVADRFRAWVEALPCYEPTAPPFFFRDQEPT